MRMKSELVLAVMATLASSSAPYLLAGGLGDAKADQIMAEARKALGGDQKLSAIKGLSVRADFRRELTGSVPGGGGSTFVMMGGGGAVGGVAQQMSGSLEVDVVFPDKFYRQETSTGGFAVTRIDGFDGDRPFLDVISNSPNTRVSVDQPGADPVRAKAALKRTNTDLARLLLGMVGSTHAGMQVTYAYAGQAESPDGTAHVIDVTGPEDFKARLFIDSTTHLPLMLTYAELEPRPVRMMTSHDTPSGGGSPRVVTGSGAASPTRMSDLTPEQRAEVEKQMKEAEQAPRKMLDYRMYFSEYREVDGVSLPHRISRGTGEKTTEEWEVKSYKVNPTVKADRFKVGSE